MNLPYFIFSGHVIDSIPELPLVVTDKVQELTKTKQAVGFLRRIRAWPDVQKVLENFSHRIHIILNKLNMNICRTFRCTNLAE